MAKHRGKHNCYAWKDQVVNGCLSVLDLQCILTWVGFPMLTRCFLNIICRMEGHSGAMQGQFTLYGYMLVRKKPKKVCRSFQLKCTQKLKFWDKKLISSIFFRQAVECDAKVFTLCILHLPRKWFFTSSTNILTHISTFQCTFESTNIFKKSNNSLKTF